MHESAGTYLLNSRGPSNGNLPLSLLPSHNILLWSLTQYPLSFVWTMLRGEQSEQSLSPPTLQSPTKVILSISVSQENLSIFYSFCRFATPISIPKGFL